MKIFDTHSHISLEQFAEDREEVVARMLDAGVTAAVVVADATEDVPFAARMCEEHPFLFLAVGVHPHNAEKYDDAAEQVIYDAMEYEKFACLGEIGLDYHYDLSPRETQREVFDRQLDIAFARGKTAQLHIRDAHGDCMDILRARRAAGRLPKFIMHCYTGGWELAKEYIAMGGYISLTGAVTFKSAPKLSEVAKNTPLDRLLIETDCPYMTPVPLRGKRNEPAYIVHTLSKVAEIRETDADALSAALFDNALRAFGIGE